MSLDRIAAHVQEHQQVVAASLDALAGPAGAVAAVLVEMLEGGGKVLAFGNGGSAAQASHFAGELMGRFRHARDPLPALALATDPAAFSCIGNDFGFEAVFERQVGALARPGDLALGLTTSGASQNVLRGLAAAAQRGAVTVALTGAHGLRGASADHLLAIPSTDTAFIQEVHLVLLHAWCACIDAALLPTQDADA